MSCAVTNADQKCKEFWGHQITTNPLLDERKQEVNQLNNYLQMVNRTVVTKSQCHTLYLNIIELQTHYNQCAMIVTKIYEHEVGQNKVIGTNLIKMSMDKRVIHFIHLKMYSSSGLILNN